MAKKLMTRSDYESLSLKHHGILGMRWGIRRLRAPDGRRTGPEVTTEQYQSMSAAQRARKFASAAAQTAANVTQTVRNVSTTIRDNAHIIIPVAAVAATIGVLASDRLGRKALSAVGRASIVAGEAVAVAALKTIGGVATGSATVVEHVGKNIPKYLPAITALSVTGLKIYDRQQAAQERRRLEENPDS